MSFQVLAASLNLECPQLIKPKHSTPGMLDMGISVKMYKCGESTLFSEFRTQ